jgi:hypothetical protein
MSEPSKVGLAEALRQRELDDEERDSSNDNNDDWGTGPDSPTKKTVRAAIPYRFRVYLGQCLNAGIFAFHSAPFQDW